jgi:hypothetical protein
LWLALILAPYLTREDEWLTQLLQNHAGDAFGALIIVWATKYLFEKGSKESKDPDAE